MRRLKAFTLLELVIVILILGIVAAIAVPRMANQTQDAKKNSARQSLGILRNAIELYNAKNGEYPQTDSTNTLNVVLATYLNGPFPAPGIGHHASSNVVGDGTQADANVTAGWIYDKATGALIINSADVY